MAKKQYKRSMFLRPFLKVCLLFSLLLAGFCHGQGNISKCIQALLPGIAKTNSRQNIDQTKSTAKPARLSKKQKTQIAQVTLNLIDEYFKMKDTKYDTESNYKNAQQQISQIIDLVNEHAFLKSKDFRIQKADHPSLSFWDMPTMKQSRLVLGSQTLNAEKNYTPLSVEKEAAIYAPKGVGLLQIAALLGDTWLLHELLSAGVDPRTIKTKKGSIEHNILHIALKKGLKDVTKTILTVMPVQYFGSHKARFIDEKDPYKQTPGQMAIMRFVHTGHSQSLEYLKKHQPSGEVEFYHLGERYDATEFVIKHGIARFSFYFKVSNSYLENKTHKAASGRRVSPP